MEQRDTNECRLAGVVEKIRPITTKTGAAMVEIILKVRRDRFRVVLFVGDAWAKWVLPGGVEARGFSHLDVSPVTSLETSISAS